LGDNLLEGHAADYGIAPFGYYFTALFSSTGVALLFVVLGLGLAATLPAARPLLALVLAELALLSLLPHKELRFVLPVLPLLLALAAVGLVQGTDLLTARFAPRAGGVAWLLAGTAPAALMVLRAPNATYGDLGRLERDALAATPVGQAFADFNRLLFRGFALPDLCGVAVAGAPLIWMGGYSYLHRNLPLFELDPPTPNGSPAANYVLAPSAWSQPPRATLVAREGQAALYRFSHSCAAPPKDFDKFELPPSLKGFPAPR
jgi:GPI mannosyltransferase 3